DHPHHDDRCAQQHPATQHVGYDALRPARGSLTVSALAPRLGWIARCRQVLARAHVALRVWMPSIRHASRCLADTATIAVLAPPPRTPCSAHPPCQSRAELWVWTASDPRPVLRRPAQLHQIVACPLAA